MVGNHSDPLFGLRRGAFTYSGDDDGVLSATLPTSFEGTFSYQNTVGDITLSSFTRSDATVILRVSNDTGRIINSSATTITASSLELRSVADITINNNLTVSGGSLLIETSGSITRTGNTTVTAPTLTINAGGSIGASGTPIIIDRTSDAWTADTLTLSSDSEGSIYLSGNDDGVLTAFNALPPSFEGTFSFQKTSGDITLSSFTRSNATVIFRVSSDTGRITYSSATTITASSLELYSVADIAYSNNLTISGGSLLIETSGSITRTGTAIVSSPDLTLNAGGSIGASGTPIIIDRTSATHGRQTTLTLSSDYRGKYLPKR